MQPRVISLAEIESVDQISRVLASTSHAAFPVADVGLRACCDASRSGGGGGSRSLPRGRRPADALRGRCSGALLVTLPLVPVLEAAAGTLGETARPAELRAESNACSAIAFAASAWLAPLSAASRRFFSCRSRARACSSSSRDASSRLAASLARASTSDSSRTRASTS